MRSFNAHVLIRAVKGKFIQRGRFALKLLLLIFTALNEPCLGAPAETNASASAKAFSLAQAKQIAFQNNWDLLAAKSGVDLATAQKIVSKEFTNPTLAASVQKINFDNHSSSTARGNGLWDRNYDTILAVNQLFEIGGKRKYRQLSASANFEVARAQLWDARRILDAAVSKAFIAALLAEENVKVLRNSAKSLRQETEIAETRFKAGDISSADKSQIEIAADKFSLDADTSESNAKTARIAVETLLGEKNPQGNWVSGDTLDSLAIGFFEAEQSKPGASRPDLLAAEASLKKSEADLKLQKAMRIPDPAFLAQYEHQPPDQPSTVGIGVSFPLPLWNRNRGNIKSAEAARNQAGIQVEKIHAQIFSETATAELSYRSAASRWKKYSENIRPKSEDVLKTVEFSYKKGGASLLDLLTAERNDNDIRLATAQALADSATAAANLASAKNISTDSNQSQSNNPKENNYEKNKH
ncbi:MAG: TolC family protein [Verrucomicrobiota bacterium]|nr:TolC family protein [Verrucomicrobiota bacterium]